jgi:hypothetical protein
MPSSFGDDRETEHNHADSGQHARPRRAEARFQAAHLTDRSDKSPQDPALTGGSRGFELAGLKRTVNPESPAIRIGDYSRK